MEKSLSPFLSLPKICTRFFDVRVTVVIQLLALQTMVFPSSLRIHRGFKGPSSFYEPVRLAYSSAHFLLPSLLLSDLLFNGVF